MNRKDRTVSFAALALLAATGSAASAQFVTGGLWNRFIDWADPATVPANPSRAVWQYETINLTRLTSDTPWFAQATEPARWQPDPEAPGQGKWVAGPEGNAVFQRDRARVIGGDEAISPVARWHNPAGDGSPISITGRVRFQVDSESSEAGLELVVAVTDRWGNIRPLYTQSLTAEEVGEMSSRGLVVPIELRNVIVNQGDSIILTARVDDVSSSGDEPVVVDLMDDISIVMESHQETEDLQAFASFRKQAGLHSAGGRGGGGGGGGGGTPFNPPQPPDIPPPPDMPPPDVPDEPVIPTPGTLVLLMTAAGCTLSRRRRA